MSVLDSNLQQSRRWIRRLINEDELRRAVILVIINSFDQPERELSDSVNNAVSQLGLEELPSLIDNPDRFGWYVVNAKEGERNEQWQTAWSWITNWIAIRLKERVKGGAVEQQQ